MLLHACGGFPGASMPPRGLSRGLQGAPQGLERKMRPPRTAKASSLAEAEISRGMVRLD